MTYYYHYDCYCFFIAATLSGSPIGVTATVAVTVASTFSTKISNWRFGPKLKASSDQASVIWRFGVLG